jgi:hypothetical protein
MPSVKEVAEIMVDADTLWKAVGDFDTAARWQEATQTLGRGVIQGGVVIAVHPRGDIEILEIAEPVELRSTDLDNQT